MGSSNFGIPELSLCGQILHDESAFCARYGSLVGEKCPRKPTSARKKNRNGNRTMVSSLDSGAVGKETPQKGASKACASGMWLSKVLFPIEEAPEEILAEAETSAKTHE